MHIIRFKNYFKFLLLNTGLALKELKNSNRFGSQRHLLINDFLELVNMHKKRFSFCRLKNLRQPRPLFFLLHRFCLYLKKKKNIRVKQYSDFLFSIILSLKARHLAKNVSDLNFF